MSNAQYQYRNEGSLALQAHIHDDSCCVPIISIEDLIPSSSEQCSKKTRKNRLRSAFMSDPLLGSLKYASNKDRVENQQARLVFIKGSALFSLFGLIVVLIGA